MTTTTHDSINLRRLTRRLQKSVNTEEWSQGSTTEQEVWIKAMGTLQVFTSLDIALAELKRR